MTEKTLFEQLLNTGTKAILAGARGDQEEWDRLIKKGKELHAEIDRQTTENLIQSFEADAKFVRKPKPKKQPSLSTNLGDVFKAAGVVK